jgi:exonuclease III
MLLRVITYNILDGGVGREGFILEVLRTLHPDIAILQEVMDPATASEFAKALNLEFYFAKGNTKRHLALLSRLPIISAHSYHPFPIYTSILEARFEYASNQYLAVFGVHLVAQPFILFELWRQWEVKRLLQRLRSNGSDLCLIAGDFNAIAPHDPVATKFWPRLLKLMVLLQGGRIFRNAIREVTSAGFSDCYRMWHPDKNGFTLPTPTPNVRLDYIFVDEGLKNCLRKCWVVREPAIIEQASDHYPVMAEFELRVG